MGKAKVMADFHYFSQGQAQGPVPEAELNRMIESGQLASDTLIWSEGMKDWQPYAAVRSAPAGAPSAPSAVQGTVALAAPPVAGGMTCSVCQQVFPPDQVIRYGASVVCGNCKPQFLQRLREGAQVGERLDYARFGKRFAAKMIDTLLIYAVNFGIGFAMGTGVQGEAPNPMLGLVLLVVNLSIAFGYPIVFVGKWGQTLGKMALKIKVVSPQGEPIGYAKATGRVLSEIVTGFTFGIGYLMVLWDDQRRALHDRLASTRVINL
jgi:uncharacterized RDD family membrane protein YckC